MLVCVCWHSWTPLVPVPHCVFLSPLASGWVRRFFFRRALPAVCHAAAPATNPNKPLGWWGAEAYGIMGREKCRHFTSPVTHADSVRPKWHPMVVHYIGVRVL